MLLGTSASKYEQQLSRDTCGGIGWQTTMAAYCLAEGTHVLALTTNA